MTEDGRQKAEHQCQRTEGHRTDNQMLRYSDDQMSRPSNPIARSPDEPMTLSWLLASVHLLALGVGLGAVWVRNRALRGALDAAGLRRVFAADALWGVAAILWIGTGVWRAFGGVEKGAEYYLSNPLFHAKMGLLLVVLALEIGPAIAFVRWRRKLRAGEPVDTSLAPRYAGISTIQAVLVVGMVLAATAMARGMGVSP